MATDGTGDALSARIDALEREVREVHARLTASRRVRLITLLLGISFLVVIAGVSYSLYARVRSEAFVNELSAAGQAHLEANRAVYAAEGEKLAAYARPMMARALQQQVEQDSSKYSDAIAAQRQVLLENLQPRMKEMMNERYAAALQSFQHKLTEEFPEANDPDVEERIRATLEDATQGLVDRYYVEHFQNQMEALAKTWEDFPAADIPKAGEESLGSQLLGHLMEIMTYQLANPPEDVDG